MLKVGAARTAATWWRTVVELRWAILTVAAVLALAYVMNASAQTTAIGLAVAGAGAALAFLSPVLGWFGVAVTGSDTSANALFGALQVTAAQGAGLPPELLAGANSSGGVLGKMLSPQNLTIACAAVKLEGQEGVLLRKVIGWSLGMLVVLATLIFLQSTPVLGWMLPWERAGVSGRSGPSRPGHRCRPGRRPAPPGPRPPPNRSPSSPRAARRRPGRWRPARGPRRR